MFCALTSDQSKKLMRTDANLVSVEALAQNDETFLLLPVSIKNCVNAGLAFSISRYQSSPLSCGCEITMLCENMEWSLLNMFQALHTDQLKEQMRKPIHCRC